jgi:hypothetical protein
MRREETCPSSLALLSSAESPSQLASHLHLGEERSPHIHDFAVTAKSMYEPKGGITMPAKAKETSARIALRGQPKAIAPPLPPFRCCQERSACK